MSLFHRLKERILVSLSDQPDEPVHPQLGRVILLLETALYDDEYAEQERQLIFRLFREKYGLSESEIESLIELARERREDYPDIQSLTRKMVADMKIADRVELMTEIWQVVFADARVDRNEELFARKMRTLLRLDHKDWISAKLKAKESSG